MPLENKGDLTSPAAQPDRSIRFGTPELVSFGLSGVTFAVGAEIAAIKQSGRVDFLTFKDFRINGVAVEIEEYRHPFSIKKGVVTSLPRPTTVFVRSTSLAKAAYKEFAESASDWTVTGTVFVFGKFKKYGFGFKRVIPIKIDQPISNPLRPAGS